MRRTDREVTDRNTLVQILEECKVCRIAMQDSEGLYLVPMNFGYSYENNRLFLYFHSAKDGRKIRALKENSRVCFEMDCGHELVEGETACQYGYRFSSILGNGTIRFLTESVEKERALQLLMLHQTGRNFTFTESMTAGVEVFELQAESFTGKRRL